MNVYSHISLYENLIFHGITSPDSSLISIIPFRYVTSDVAFNLGIHFPACHVQQFAHQTNFESFPQYRLDGLPSFQTDPAHPLPMCMPFTNVGRDVQSVVGARNESTYGKWGQLSSNKNNRSNFIIF